MNYFQKTALFIGVATAINGLTFAAQAQFCADPSHRAATKARLDQIADSQGIEMGDVGKAYENFALATIRLGTPIPENTRRFFSDARKRQTKDKYQNVVPDGVLPLVFVNFPAGPTETYPDSVFYEVKALSGGLLPPSYSDYQILGFIDALGDSSAKTAGRIPAIIFLTSADIKQISNATVAEAIFRGVAVWHAIGCEIPGSFNQLQLGAASLKNPVVYFLQLTLPEGIGPGIPGRLFIN
ncbi:MULTISPECIES: hypothetical protein [unclassified Microcoleus]|uniref:hypothetical protein n=1 Tax=unclassified Microcoleus TaxID=2642155 RepID=UPI002FD329B3